MSEADEIAYKAQVQTYICRIEQCDGRAHKCWLCGGRVHICHIPHGTACQACVGRGRWVCPISDAAKDGRCGFCRLGQLHSETQHDAWVQMACDPEDD